MPPKLMHLQHIGLKVRDIQASLRFYTEVLGFEVAEYLEHPPDTKRANTANAFITCTSKHHVINLVQMKKEYRPEDFEPENTRTTKAFGTHHFAFEVEDKAAFEAWRDHLSAHGVEFVREPLVHSPTHPEGDGTWGENRAMYFCDPDGNAIEIFCDMAEVDFERHEIEPEWFADRLERDGYRRDEVPVPPLTR